MKASLKIKDSARKQLSEVIRRMGDAGPALNVIGEIVHESIQTNFEDGGRPRPWKLLSPATIAQRKKSGHWPGRILVRKGVSGGLMGAVSYRAFNNKVVWTANKVYAAIHNYGGQAGRGRKVTIPGREFMLIQDEDWQEIDETMKDFIVMGNVS